MSMYFKLRKNLFVIPIMSSSLLSHCKLLDIKELSAVFKSPPTFRKRVLLFYCIGLILHVINASRA